MLQAERPPVVGEGEGHRDFPRGREILAGRLDAMDVENHSLQGQDAELGARETPVDDEPGPANNGWLVRRRRV